MIREEFYTEITAESFRKLSVDLKNKVYEIEENISEYDIDMEIADFLAPILFDALIAGLEVKGFKKN